MKHSNCRAVKPLSVFTLIVLLLVDLLFVNLFFVISIKCRLSLLSFYVLSYAGIHTWPRHTKGVKNGTNGYLAWRSAL